MKGGERIFWREDLFFPKKRGWNIFNWKKGGENFFQTFFLETGKIRVPCSMLSPAFAVAFMANTWYLELHYLNKQKTRFSFWVILPFSRVWDKLKGTKCPPPLFKKTPCPHKSNAIILTTTENMYLSVSPVLLKSARNYYKERTKFTGHHIF